MQNRFLYKYTCLQRMRADIADMDYRIYAAKHCNILGKETLTMNNFNIETNYIREKNIGNIIADLAQVLED